MTPGQQSIVLIGMMGAGKSSVGRCLQRKTGLVCFDTDEIVSARFGVSIPDIFSKFGEEAFRQAETAALAELDPVVPAIVVTGGGVVLREENRQHLKRLGVVVWLEAEASTLLERASRRGNRPLLQTEDPSRTISEMLQNRRPLYTEVADVRVNTTNCSHEEVADTVLASMNGRSSI
ncbi:MAG: shikimate kinase [Verrucomicrobiota bacterium]|jgi:shikimate kinase